MKEFRPINFDALTSDIFALCRWLAKHIRRWRQARVNKNHRREAKEQ